MPDVAEEWLSVQEAADLCGVTYRTVYRMLRRGELPAEKPEGRPYRLRKADVDAVLERMRVEPGQLASAPQRIAPGSKTDS
jgi:excisionase family DNA binding protein